MIQSMIFGGSRTFRKVIDLADEYSRGSWPVLILGETGVGKELLAQRIHSRSIHASAAFVPVNCGAIPAPLFESELFGYEKGAFSGAVQSSRGLLRSANNGTLFLDEIGELDIILQAKLLRWLDSGEVRSLGSSRIETVTARLISATNVDLCQEVARGDFRLDLFERLGVLTLHVPPLRQRKEDILPIAQHFLNLNQASFNEADLELLTGFPWPGNIRQLRNALVRAIARGGGKLVRTQLVTVLEEEENFSRTVQSAGQSLFGGSLADAEKHVIIDRIRRCHGNKKKAAKELGIAKSTLHEKIRRWKTEGPAGRDSFGHALLGAS